MRHPFLRTLAGSATDPNFENVTLLLHGDGTNGGQNNTFVDGSTNNFSITRNGNTTQGTFSPYGDNWSNYFDGTGDYLSLADNNAWDFGSGNFTVEAWFYTASTATQSIVAQVASTGNANASSFSLYASVSGFPAFYISFGTNYTTITSGTATPVNQWVHLAAVRNGSTITLYQNGVSVATASVGTSAVTLSAANLGVGRTGDFNGEYLTGYISNVRIVKGTAVYTAAFTPSTTPLTSITNTSLLTCQSNRFRDASTNNFTITRNGDVSVQRFSPFSPTAAYAAGTIGGSGYFDGTGDYLSAAYNSAFDITSGDFCAEAWVYRTVAGAEHYILSQRQDSPARGWELRINSGNTVTFLFTGGSVLTSTTTIPTATWTHLAATRQTNTFRMFINGALEASSTFSNGTATTSQLYIGSTTSSPQTYAQAYISDARIVKGSAVYTAAFTPPTAPLTAITNTSLLLNFQNAAILDNAMMAVPETVGNAQIDTTTKKFGTGSLEFDGTGDWLLVPDSIDQRLGTGNFTIECWLYLSATGTARGIVGKGTSTTGWLLSTNTSNAVVFTYGTSTITSTGTLSGTTWYHIAVVREGTGSNQTKIYIGGTNDGTGTVSTDFTQTNAAYVGANRTGGDPMNGYIDDLRITKGVARYTANFTAPTAAFPDL